MKKFLLLNFTVILSLLFSQSAFAEMFLFIDENCPYCNELDAYLAQNSYYEKFQIQTFEVRNNPANEAFYIQKAQELGYKDLLLPWLVHDKTFYDGKTDIANYLNSLNAQVAETETEDLSADYLNESNADLLANIVEAGNEEEKVNSDEDYSQMPKILNKEAVILILGIFIIAILICILKKRKQF